jgi:hypothetical protein
MSSRISLDPKILFIIFDIDAPMVSVCLRVLSRLMVCEPCSIGVRTVGGGRIWMRVQAGSRRAQRYLLAGGEMQASAITCLQEQGR